jgi:hypothetical protein
MPEPVAYQLSIAPAFERFRPELEYACDFLDGCHHVRRTPRAATVLHYGSDAPAGSIVVPAAVFPDAVHLDAEGIHPDRLALRDLELGKGDVALLPKAGQTSVGHRRLPYDALGLIFLMLSRLEERASPDLDRYRRFPLQSSLAFRIGRHADPLADQAARDLASAITGHDDPTVRTSYEVCLTHDVDSLRGYHRPLEPLRWAAGDLVKRGDPKRAWRRVYTAYLAGEPWTSFRELMDAAERIGRPARFFFMGPSTLSMDSPYVITMRGLLKRVADEIVRRGHAVGFHPGFATAADPAEWCRQREGLEAVIGWPVREGRQHVLQHDAAMTPDIWANAGMERDYTLAFPDASGFRSGTCRPHAAYSLRSRKVLPLERVATSIMEFSFFGGRYREMPLEQALEECAAIVRVCKRYGGTAVVLYHPGQTDPAMKQFYRSLLTIV